MTDLRTTSTISTQNVRVTTVCDKCGNPLIHGVEIHHPHVTIKVDPCEACLKKAAKELNKEIQELNQEITELEFDHFNSQ